MELTPEDRKRIYEEEKAKIEAEKKDESNKKIKPSHDSKEGKRGLIILISITVFLFILTAIIGTDDKDRKSKSNQNPSANKGANNKYDSSFLYAFEGDYWEIKDNNIAVSIQPKIYANESQFNRNLVSVIGYGTKVEILESKGYLSPWKRVYYYNSSNQIAGEGWILAETVKGAERIKKGLYSP